MICTSTPGAPRAPAEPRLLRAPTVALHAAIALTALGLAREAQAFCSFEYNGWAQACEQADGDPACFANAAAELATPSVLPQVIPVYLNFGTTLFPVPHPNYPDDPAQVQNVHRSLTLTGLSKTVVIAQVRQALAQWNQASPSQPMLYYAGEVAGDTAKIENRKVGITVDAELCWSRREGASAFASPPEPMWTVGDNTAYRSRVTIMPYNHSVQGQAPGFCNSLPDSLNPRPLIDCPDGSSGCVDTGAPGIGFRQVSRTSRIKDGFVHVLVHELGHALGLHHNFFTAEDGDDDAIPGSCGLGLHNNKRYGVMSYNLSHPVHPRRDDIEGMVALFGDQRPTSWSLQAWRAAGALPNSDAAKDASINGLTTTVPPVLSNQVVSTFGRVGLAFASADRQVRVRTITNGVLDPVAGGLDVPLAGAQGQTYFAPGVAMATAASQAHQLFAIWNVDDPTKPELKARWATRTLMNGAWTNYPPQDLGVTIPGNIVPPDAPPPVRVHPPLGVTYDPVYDDYVVVTVSQNYHPGVTVIERNGSVSYGPSILKKSGFATTTPVDDYNAVGAPVCIRRPVGSLCLLPVITSGNSNRVGILSFTRSAAAPEFSTVTETLSTITGYGQVSISWNAKTNVGYISSVDDKGDVRWQRVDVSPANVVTFTPLAFSMDGNGRYAPAVLGGQPRQVVDNMRYDWPICPYWGATSGAVGDPAIAASAVTAARAICKPRCRDGRVDPGEDCELGDLAGETCATLGYAGGNLGCNVDCTFDLDECVNDPPPPSPGDCQEVLMSCGDVGEDGCYPDGPGSYGKGGDGQSGGGYYCPDDDGPAVCSLARQDGQLEPKCILCPEPGAGGEDAGYGCGCDSDADCAPSGWASTSGAPNGTQVALSCFGSTDQGWSAGPGRCLPAIDPDSPQLQTADGAALEEFERTRWLCKQSCGALSDALGNPFVCHYRQGGLQLDYAACVDAQGCGGNPTGGCEETGLVCGAGGGCEAQCDPAANVPGVGNPACAASGFPAYYQCTQWTWSPEHNVQAGLCVPPECAADPLSSGLDLSACMMFLSADVF
jgi:hypothetical protein